VPSGINIRDSAGATLGSRKPLSSNSVKTETLPIASITLSMNESSDLDAFPTHWQEVVTVDLDAIREVRQTNAAQTDMFFPTSFFDASPTRRSIPSSIRMNRKETEDYLNCFRAFRPANTADLAVHLLLTLFFTRVLFFKSLARRRTVAVLKLLARRDGILRFGLVVRSTTSKGTGAGEEGGCCSLQDHFSYFEALKHWH
jgi:hypothetical protein